MTGTPNPRSSHFSNSPERSGYPPACTTCMRLTRGCLIVRGGGSVSLCVVVWTGIRMRGGGGTADGRVGKAGMARGTAGTAMGTAGNDRELVLQNPHRGSWWMNTCPSTFPLRQHRHLHARVHVRPYARPRLPLSTTIESMRMDEAPSLRVKERTGAREGGIHEARVHEEVRHAGDWGAQHGHGGCGMGAGREGAGIGR